jgi:sugar phosphate isomerase/epimerase
MDSTRIRKLGTMIAYGFADRELVGEFHLAHRLGAEVLEIFPQWRAEPDPALLRARVAEAGLAIHSAHGCWGGQTIRAGRVDLGHPDAETHRDSVDDLKRCVDWLAAAGGTCLVVHPGGLSNLSEQETRKACLVRGLAELSAHAEGSDVILCVENMPPGVHPGSRMADLAALVTELGASNVALALDTGHAHIAADPASETRAAGGRLRTTHVHDNDGRQDTHLPPGHGTIDWDAWGEALDDIDYWGPVMLECIRHVRKHPEVIDERLIGRLRRLTGAGPV